LPRNQRKLVTNHDAFGYFAKEYGFTVMPIAGLSKNDQPGSKKVAELVAQIKGCRGESGISPKTWRIRK
jgi:ABC-type Zn uptake system ZnuABC Zn-binding protein ZnuA